MSTRHSPFLVFLSHKRGKIYYRFGQLLFDSVVQFRSSVEFKGVDLTPQLTLMVDDGDHQRSFFWLSTIARRYGWDRCWRSAVRAGEPLDGRCWLRGPAAWRRR